MTEAQKCLHHIAENMRMDKSISKEGYEYFQQAIKALEQEPCEDAVSRRAAIEIARSNIHYGLDKEYECSRELLEKTIAEINSLPPVTPKSETVTEFADRCRELS